MGTSAFNLTRYFSMLSLLLVVMAGLVLGVYFYRFSAHHMLSQAEYDNVTMTQFLRNAMYEKFSRMVTLTDTENPETVRLLQINNEALHQAVQGLIRGSDIIKVKLYNRYGITVFSTDTSQLGEDISEKAEFQLALQGRVSTEIKKRDAFVTYDGELRDVNFIASYIPMRDENGEIDGVFETYREVSPLLHRVSTTLWQVAWGAVLGLALLYLAQLLVVRYAQRILRHQANELETVNRDLDWRVRERTVLLENEIAERVNVEKRLEHLAHHDPLTGLPNRLKFKQQLLESLARIGTDDAQRIAVLFIDLDRFKDVNDTLGHSVGDELLVSVTRRINTCVRKADILARHGGDEFICILSGIEDEHEVSVIAEQLLGQFEQPFTVDGNELFLSASIGISIAPDDGHEVDILVRNADAAMYEAKAHGKNRCHFYSPEMTSQAQQRIRMDTLLRHAIEYHELAVHFQPKIDIRNGQINGAEALLRWNNPDLGSVPPDQFIPLAEDNGHIVEIGAWVMREACRHLLAWDKEGFHIPSISINLSIKQLERADFILQVRELLRETALAPSRIEFEITESVIMSVDNSLSVLNELRELGVSLSVDDFGTGYSSLAYLKELPVQVIKIDRSFVGGIGVSPSDEAIIRTIIELSHSLGFVTVAEGIESVQQEHFLRDTGCHLMQGYLYGKALSADDFRSRWDSLDVNRP